MTAMKSRSSKTYRKRRAAGQCVYCGQPDCHGRAYCDRCANGRLRHKKRYPLKQQWQGIDWATNTESFSEIGERLGVTYQAVYYQWRKATGRLKECPNPSCDSVKPATWGFDNRSGGLVRRCGECGAAWERPLPPGKLGQKLLQRLRGV